MTRRISTATFAARAGLFDASHMYRSTGQIDGDAVKMWVAGADASSNWRIGYARVPLSNWPAP